MLGLGVVAMVVALSVSRTAARLRVLWESDIIGPRVHLWGSALEAIVQQPMIGYGLGASGAAMGLNQEGYPHNILLQFWLDGGIVPTILGVVVLMVPLVLGIKEMLSDRTDPIPVPALALTGAFAFETLEFMKSTDAYAARSLVVIGCMLAVMGSWRSVTWERHHGTAD